VPKDLAALLLEDGAVPAEALARAQARHREAGGALDTALIEVGALPEDVLVEHLARAAELPAAPESAWSANDARARRVFPSRVAERHGLAPFALDGRELALVATYPVDLGLLDEISFMLSLHLTAHVGPEWRVRELIHRLYGSPLSPRLAALAAAAGRPPAPREEAAPPPEEPPPEPPPPPAPSGFEHDESEPREPLAAALQQALESVDPSLFEDEGGAEALAEEPEGPPPDRSAPPHWSVADARAALAAARRRDEVVIVALRYARDFFEYAAIFAVTRDAVAGHDALGAEDERDRARSVAIYAADPGIFKTVIETRSPYLGPVSRDAPGNAAILDGLGRGSPRTVLVLPILLRDRTVCVLYADNGEAPVSPRRLGDLLLLLSTAGAAFERIIRDRKKRRRPAQAAPPPPAPAADPTSAEPAPAADPPPDVADLAVPLSSGSFGEAAPAADPRLDDVAISMDDVPIEEDLASIEPAPAPSEEDAAPRAPAGPTDGKGGALEDRFFFGAPIAAPRAPAAAEPPAPGKAQGEPARPPAAATPSAAAPPPHEDSVPLPALADQALDQEPAVSAQARSALWDRRRDPGMRQATEKLRRALLSGLSGRATRAAHALGEIRDVEAIPLLIQVLEMSEPDTASAAADALAAITLQRLGADARKWLAWWKQNRGRGRAEWLFSGLTSADRDMRVAASAELSHAAPPPEPYSADAPAVERERVARAWAGWWARSGHVL
jgi:type II secretion system (T2SS) protein E